VDLITTLDADIYFYSSLEPIYKELGENSILITPHRFPDKLKYKEIYGLFNVSFQMFRRDEKGLECLKQWQDSCIEWCYDRLEGNKFADQKYLDEWTTKFNGVRILSNIGAGLAPWNLSNYELIYRDNKLFVDQDELIFFHFHGLKNITSFLILNGLDEYQVKVTKEIKDYLYKPYIKSLAPKHT